MNKRLLTESELQAILHKHDLRYLPLTTAKSVSKEQDAKSVRLRDKEWIEYMNGVCPHRDFVKRKRLECLYCMVALKEKCLDGVKAGMEIKYMPKRYGKHKDGRIIK